MRMLVLNFIHNYTFSYLFTVHNNILFLVSGAAKNLLKTVGFVEYCPVSQTNISTL